VKPPPEGATTTEAEARAPRGETAPGPPPRRRRWLRRTIVLAVAGMFVLALASVIPALAMKSDLERGKAELTQGERLLLAGNVDAAASAFGRAQAAFDSARTEPGSFLLRVDGWVPLLGRTPDALRSLTRIGGEISSAGAAVANRVADLPGGLEALGPKDGRLPIETLSSLAPVMDRARADLARAQGEAARLPDSWVLGPVAEARDLLRQKLERAVPLIRAADALVHQLPAFAGLDGPVRYFVAPQNLAEARGTGGLIGNYSILTIDRGRFSFGDFSSVSVLPNLPASEAPAATPLYDAFGGGGFWLNLNMTPDAPSAASMIESLYQRVEGTRLDGTVFVDLQALAAMLEVTGPVHIKEFDATISAENVVQFVATAKYLDLPWEVTGVRRETLGPRLVAEAVLGRFFSLANGQGAIRTLVSAAANGHILLHSAHKEVQAAFREAGVAGGFVPPAGSDLFGVITDNAAANKVDYYMQRDMRYAVTLGPNGTGTARADVTFRNLAPKTSQASYSLGPNAGTGLDPGENRSWTAFYCPASCRLTGATENGSPLELPYYQDLGLSMHARFLQVKAGQAERVGLSLQLGKAWTGDVASGTYELRLQGQPSVRAITATAVIEAPPGMRITWTSVPMRIDGSRATWHGVLLPNQDLTVRFGKPALLGAWSRFWHALGRPAVRI
jgi:hypothetical protein